MTEPAHAVQALVSVRIAQPVGEEQYASSSVVRLAASGEDGPAVSLARTIARQVGAKSFSIVDLRLDHTLEEIGALLGVTRERVRQVEKRTRALLLPLVRTWAQPFEQSVRGAPSLSPGRLLSDSPETPRISARSRRCS